VQAPQRTALNASTLIRLLARLTDVEFTESRQSLADRLSQWVHWTDAIALSTALSGSPPVVPSRARVFSSAEETECARVRDALANAIVGDRAFGASKRHGRALPAPAAPMEAAADYPVFRQHYLSMQQAMETAVGPLRGRLRGMLAARAPALTRLAEVDAVMERALGARERSLLATVPGLLGGHFDRLRKANQAGQQAGQDALAEQRAVRSTDKAADTAVDNATGKATDKATDDPAEKATGNPGNTPAAQTPDAPPALAPGAWLDVFRKDMQSVLLAELDLRFQPVEGLLAALRTR
jgi:hypothetical protein